jgi:hypothetical protein
MDNGTASDWVAIESMAITADGSAMFVLTDDGYVSTGPASALPATGTGNGPIAGGDMALWYTPMPVPSSMGAKRMYFIEGSGDNTTTKAEVKLNPDWAASPSIYILDRSTTPDRFLVSHNAGATWLTRTAPAATINMWAVVDQNTIYATMGNQFYKSTNGAWTWDAPTQWVATIDAGQGSMTVLEDGTIFIFDDGATKSSNGGASFSTVGSYGQTGTNGLLVVDDNFADNGIAYSVDNSTGQVLRLDVAANTWRELKAAPRIAGGEQGILFEMVDGVLYLVNGQGAYRNSSPTASLSTAAGSWVNLDFISGEPWALGANEAVMNGHTIFVNGNSANATSAFNYEDFWALVDSTALAKP